ncbi:cyclic GMP-AMP synthase-like [Saccostrea cucullata]|uniref:cyclic GMP-AMP synthase-like n=1 Tax=Saccostrea cuccullata TaxID=36930 RepID=UPI002ED0E257
MPIKCTVCQHECLNEHGLKIHFSIKHKEDHAGKHKICDTGKQYCSGMTENRVTKPREVDDAKHRQRPSTIGENDAKHRQRRSLIGEDHERHRRKPSILEKSDDKHRRRPPTTGRKDEQTDKGSRQLKSSCTEKPKTDKDEQDAKCSGYGEAGGSTKVKHTKASPIKGRPTSNCSRDVGKSQKDKKLVKKDQQRQQTPKVYPEQLLRGTKEQPDTRRLTSTPSYSSLPCPARDVSKYISMLEGGIKRRKKDSEARIPGVNKFMESLTTAFERLQDVPLDLFKSGSYYDKTKIDYDDEFDFMVYPSAKFEAVFINCPPGYCKIKKDQTTSKDLDQLCNKDGYLFPELFKQKMFSIFDTCITSLEFRQGRRTERIERQPGSPAFTLEFDLGGGNKVDIDLVPALRVDTWPRNFREIHPDWIKKEYAERAMKCFHVVTKTYPTDHPNADLLWRVSFSHAEKELILHANQKDNGCRKEIFKLLKKIKENIKNENPTKIDKFSSYHLKMFMLGFYDRHQDFSQENKERLFKQSITELIGCLRCGKIKNYFIPCDNVLFFVPNSEKTLVAHELSKIQEKC